MNLFEMHEKLARLSSDWEYSEPGSEEEKKIEEQIKGLDIQINDKIAGYCAIIKNLNLELGDYKETLSDLKRKQKTIESRMDFLKTAVQAFVEPGMKWKKGIHSISWRPSESVEITGDVPEQYQRIKEVREPDKAAIKQSLKEGATLDFARLTRKQNIQIK